ncbi:MAG TPA: RNA polymerase sigma factor [Polyangiaceae bacterium]|nr:RNA polymerase sigma factor [Polyangiaceae bacterium]
MNPAEISHDTGALYAQLKPVVDCAVRRVVQLGPADHDDLVQTAFERIVRSLQQGRFAGTAKLSTWASIISTRVAIDALRVWHRERSVFRRRMISIPEFVDAPEPADVESRLEARSELSQLVEFFDRMRPEHSLTVLLHDGFGHEVSEISALTGVSVAAAQSRLVRGRRQLLSLSKASGPAGKRRASKTTIRR